MFSKRKIMVGRVVVGGDAPVSIQTMTNTRTEDAQSTIDLINRVAASGCDIVRVSCPTKESTDSLRSIVKESPIPIIADIHFNHKRAIEAIEAGAHCVRINPGNIGDFGLFEVVEASKSNKTSIRIGINSGSIEEDILQKYKEPSTDALIESANRNIKKLEDMDFFDFKVSVKSSNVVKSIEAYRRLAATCEYPLHIGITEAGPLFPGTIKSAIGIGSLLADGIGDTIRVSLSADPIDEIKVARQILKSLGLLKNSPNIISCPTCSRTLINVIEIAKYLEESLENFKKSINISILGCVVNGPGEARFSDIGIFGFENGVAKIYFKGQEYIKCKESEIYSIIERLVHEF